MAGKSRQWSSWVPPYHPGHEAPGHRMDARNGTPRIALIRAVAGFIVRAIKDPLYRLISRYNSPLVRGSLFLLGLVVQLILLVLAWALIDTAIDLMELWVELAAKHLRIVLSEP